MGISEATKMELQTKLKLELMDWKHFEMNALRQIREGFVLMQLNKIILKEAIPNIKRLGGKTEAEINAEAKKTRKKPYAGVG